MKTQKPPAPDILPIVAEIVRQTGINETVRRSGVPRSTVFRLLLGTHPPSLDTVARVLSACGYRLDVVPVEPSDEG